MVVVVTDEGEKHPDDGEGRWYKAILTYGSGLQRIEALSGDPAHAVSTAVRIWDEHHNPAHVTKVQVPGE